MEAKASTSGREEGGATGTGPRNEASGATPPAVSQEAMKETH